MMAVLRCVAWEWMVLVVLECTLCTCTQQLVVLVTKPAEGLYGCRQPVGLLHPHGPVGLQTISLTCCLLLSERMMVAEPLGLPVVGVARVGGMVAACETAGR